VSIRTASCHCGDLKLDCKGEPSFIAMCHCEDCQRRTGSSYNLGAWYEKSAVRISGDDRIFRRTGEQGMDLAYHFCPNCGSNIFWEASMMEDAFGIAVGCFADPEFPAPTFSLYGKRQHSWLTVPKGVPCYLEGYEE
jgi:hypothetical protein